MANEFKKKGVHVLLGPVVGPMGRVVSGGRNWECEPCYYIELIMQRMLTI